MYASKPRRAPELDWIDDQRGLGRASLAVRRPAHGALAPDPASLLLVDDNELVRAAFADILTRQGYEVTSECSAAGATACLTQRQFDMMLCSTHLQGQNGIQLLNEVAEHYPEMVVILITGPATIQSALDGFQQGRSDTISTTCKQGELAIIVQRNLTRRSLQQKHAQRYRMAFETSQESILDALLSALNTRDTETQGHSERVTAYTMEIADHMGISAGEVYHIERGALLHDIGKIGISDRILHKPHKLTADEWVEMRKHPVMGYQMCVKVEMLRQASQTVLHHHERWDGSGYPDGLKAEAIPLGARIFAVADALDAMTGDRTYRAAMPFSVAREEILKSSAKQFDPAIVHIFTSITEARWQYIRTHAAR
jgi:response regulator RpfG family c-di-GMP phosphodiesterase